MLHAPGAVRGDIDVDAGANVGQPAGQRVDVAQHASGRQRFQQRARVGVDLARIPGARHQPLLHQGDLGAQIVVASAEIGERRLGVTGLPRTDDPFAGRAEQPHRAVVVDTAESVRIAVGQRRRRMCRRVGGGPGRCTRPGTWSRSGPWSRNRSGSRLDRCCVVAAGLLTRHCARHLPSASRADDFPRSCRAKRHPSGRRLWCVPPRFPTGFQQVFKQLGRRCAATFRSPVLFPPGVELFQGGTLRVSLGERDNQLGLVGPHQRRAAVLDRAEGSAADLRAVGVVPFGG